MLKNFALGVTAGGLGTTTDNLTDLAATINAWDVTDATSGITATVNQAGTALTIAGAGGGTVDAAVYGNNISTSLPLTGTPTPNADNSTVMGILSLPLNGASGRYSERHADHRQRDHFPGHAGQDKHHGQPGGDD